MKLSVTINYSEEDGYTTRESVKINKKERFSVCNLNECPEDAIIGRDLFTADDYISAVKYGMELAKKGYSDIEVNYVEED